MRTQDAIDGLRGILQGQDTTHWPDLELGRFLNRQMRSVARQMVDLDQGYFNFPLTIAKTAAIKRRSFVYEYTLPLWVQRIVDVREELKIADPTGTSSGRILLPTHKLERPGYLFNGQHLLQIKGIADAPLDLALNVAKVPARVTKGTLPDQTGMGTAQMRLDLDSGAAESFPHETEANAYGNGVFEITGTNARSGQIRRCIASAHFQSYASNLYTVLTFDAAWAVQPVAGDTYEMHLELGEEHMQYLLLLTANALWATRGNKDEQRAIAPELAEEYREFKQRITPRQTQIASFMRYTIMPPYRDTGVSNEDAPYPLWQ